MRFCTIIRIILMEHRYDTLLRYSPTEIRKIPRLQCMLRTLIAYSDSGLWLQDYTADEQGLLPRWLKRGILSEDGLYNLLCNIENAEQSP